MASSLNGTKVKHLAAAAAANFRLALDLGLRLAATELATRSPLEHLAGGSADTGRVRAVEATAATTTTTRGDDTGGGSGAVELGASRPASGPSRLWACARSKLFAQLQFTWPPNEFIIVAVPIRRRARRLPIESPPPAHFRCARRPPSRC